MRRRDALLPGSVLLAGISAAMFAGLAVVGVHLVSQTTQAPAPVSVRNVSGEVAVPEATATPRHHVAPATPSPVSVTPAGVDGEVAHRHIKPATGNAPHSTAGKRATVVAQRPTPSPTPTPTSSSAHGKGHSHANGHKP